MSLLLLFQNQRASEEASAYIEEYIVYGQSVSDTDTGHGTDVGSRVQNIPATGTISDSNQQMGVAVQATRNWNGASGTNANFSAFTYDAPSSGFYTNVQGGLLTSDDYIQVAPENGDSMSMSADFIGSPSVVGAHHYVGFECVDEGFNVIPAYTVLWFSGTLTFLTQDLNPGDTTLHLSSTANWQRGAGDPYYTHALSVYNFVGANGTVYQPGTYTQNIYRTSGPSLWTTGVNDTTNTITLSVGWSGPAITAGTWVSNGTDGGNYNYAVVSNGQIPSTWTNATATVNSLAVPGSAPSNQFWQGTKYVRWLFLTNRDVAGGATIYRNLSIQLTRIGERARVFESASRTGAQYSYEDVGLNLQIRKDGAAYSYENVGLNLIVDKKGSTYSYENVGLNLIVDKKGVTYTVENVNLKLASPVQDAVTYSYEFISFVVTASDSGGSTGAQQTATFGPSPTDTGSGNDATTASTPRITFTADPDSGTASAETAANFSLSSSDSNLSTAETIAVNVLPAAQTSGTTTETTPSTPSLLTTDSNGPTTEIGFFTTTAGADVGRGTEGDPNITIVSPATDSGSGTEPTVTVAFSTSDVGHGAEGAVGISFTISDQDLSVSETAAVTFESFTVTDTDQTPVESAAIALTPLNADSGSDSESGSITAIGLPPTADNNTSVTETVQSLTASVPASDLGTTSDSVNIAFSAPEDTGHSTDSAAPNTTYLSTDLGHGADSASISQSVTDTGSATEQAVSITFTTSDANVGTSTTVTISVSSNDNNSSASDSASLSAAVTVTDTGSGSDGIVPTEALSTTDHNGTATETTDIGVPVQDLTTDFSQRGKDSVTSIVVTLTANESATALEVVTSTATFSTSDHDGIVTEYIRRTDQITYVRVPSQNYCMVTTQKPNSVVLTNAAETSQIDLRPNVAIPALSVAQSVTEPVYT